jgi:bifunctional non-homologous end joining protein LigD
VFDILYLNGKWITSNALLERQQMLVQNVSFGDRIHSCDNYDSGNDLFKVMSSHGMEGIVAKEKFGKYHPGKKHTTWKKVKCYREIQAVVGGVLLKSNIPNALMLGLPEDKGLAYIGRVATGLNSGQWQDIALIAREYSSERSPFIKMPKIERSLKPVWIEPVITVTVNYLEWTDHGTLRNPVIKSINSQPT